MLCLGQEITAEVVTHEGFCIRKEATRIGNVLYLICLANKEVSIIHFFTMMPRENHLKAEGIASEASGSCQNCTSLQQNLNEYVSALISVKQKIIDSDHLLVEYQRKCDDLQDAERENKTLRNQLELMLQKTSHREEKELKSLRAELKEKTMTADLQQSQAKYAGVKKGYKNCDMTKMRHKAKLKKIEGIASKYRKNGKQLLRDKREMQRKLDLKKKKAMKNAETQVAINEPIVKLDKSKIKFLLEELWGCIDCSASCENNMDTLMMDRNLGDEEDFQSPDNCTPSNSQLIPSELSLKTTSESAILYSAKVSANCETSNEGNTSRSVFAECTAELSLQTEKSEKYFNDHSIIHSDNECDMEEMFQIMNWAKPLPHILSPLVCTPLTTKFADSSDNESSNGREDIEERSSTGITTLAKKLPCDQNKNCSFLCLQMESVSNCKENTGKNDNIPVVTDCIESVSPRKPPLFTEMKTDGQKKVTPIALSKLNYIHNPEVKFLNSSFTGANGNMTLSKQCDGTVQCSGRLKIDNMQFLDEENTGSDSCHVPSFNSSKVLFPEQSLLHICSNEQKSLQIDSITAKNNVPTNRSGSGEYDVPSNATKSRENDVLNNTTNTMENDVPSNTTNTMENDVPNNTTNTAESDVPCNATSTAEKGVLSITTDTTETYVPINATNTAENAVLSKTTNTMQNYVSANTGKDSVPSNTTNTAENDVPSNSANTMENDVPNNTTNATENVIKNTTDTMENVINNTTNTIKNDVPNNTTNTMEIDHHVSANITCPGKNIPHNTTRTEDNLVPDNTTDTEKNHVHNCTTNNGNKWAPDNATMDDENHVHYCDYKNDNNLVLSTQSKMCINQSNHFRNDFNDIKKSKSCFEEIDRKSDTCISQNIEVNGAAETLQVSFDGLKKNLLHLNVQLEHAKMLYQCSNDKMVTLETASTKKLSAQNTSGSLEQKMPLTNIVEGIAKSNNLSHGLHDFFIPIQTAMENTVHRDALNTKTYFQLDSSVPDTQTDESLASNNSRCNILLSSNQQLTKMSVDIVTVDDINRDLCTNVTQKKTFYTKLDSDKTVNTLKSKKDTLSINFDQSKLMPATSHHHTIDLLLTSSKSINEMKEETAMNRDASSFSSDSSEEDSFLIRKVSYKKVNINNLQKPKTDCASESIQERACNVQEDTYGTLCKPLVNNLADMKSGENLSGCPVSEKIKNNLSVNQSLVNSNAILDQNITDRYSCANEKKRAILDNCEKERKDLECENFQYDNPDTEQICIETRKKLLGKNLIWNFDRCDESIDSTEASGKQKLRTNVKQYDSSKRLFHISHRKHITNTNIVCQASKASKHYKLSKCVQSFSNVPVEETILANAYTSTSSDCSPETINKVRSEMGLPLPPLLGPLLATPPKKTHPRSPILSSSSCSSLQSPLDDLVSPLPGTALSQLVSPLTNRSWKECPALSISSSLEKVNRRILSSPLQFCATTPKHALPVPGRLPQSAASSSSTSVQENSVKILDTMYPELSARARTINILKGNVQLNQGLPRDDKNTSVSHIAGFKPIASNSTAFIITGGSAKAENSKAKLQTCEVNQKPIRTGSPNKRTSNAFLMPRSAKRLRLDTESPVIEKNCSISPTKTDTKLQETEKTCHSMSYCEPFPDTVEDHSADEDIITRSLKRIKDLCFDLLPVIRSHIFVGSIPKIPVMRNEEKEVIYEFSNSKKSLADHFLQVVLKTIKTGKTSMATTYLQALCRVYVGLCRQLGDIEKARILCYSILKEDFPNPDMLLLFIVSAWNDIISTHGVVSKAIQAVLKGLAREDVSSYLSVYLNWEKSPPMNVSVLLSSVLIAIQLYPDGKFQQSKKYGEDLTDNIWEYVFAVDLLCSHYKWVWTLEKVISKELWPLLDKWVKRKKGNPNVSFVPDIIVATVLRLVGHLCQMGIKEGFATAVKNIGAVIISFLQHANKEGMSWGVQLACVYMLFDLAPSDPAVICTTLRGWRESANNDIPPAVTSHMKVLESMCGNTSHVQELESM